MGPSQSKIINFISFLASQVQLIVCNEESDMEAAFAVGATGVMSDYPTLLSNYLKKHPPPPPPAIY